MARSLNELELKWVELLAYHLIVNLQHTMLKTIPK